jgi:hypothetical protein
VGTGAHEDDGIAVQWIDQQEVPTDAAFPVVQLRALHKRVMKTQKDENWVRYLEARLVKVEQLKGLGGGLTGLDFRAVSRRV